MNGTTLFFLQTIISFIVFAMLAWWYLLPRVQDLPLETALIPFVWVHAFRNIGLSILAPGAVDPSLPADFINGIAYGDLAAVILAILSLLALRFKVSGAIILVWIFNIIGTGDLMLAAINGLRVDAFSFPLGANWFIVTMYVPALWVSSLIIFYLLLTRKGAGG